MGNATQTAPPASKPASLKDINFQEMFNQSSSLKEDVVEADSRDYEVLITGIFAANQTDNPKSKGLFKMFYVHEGIKTSKMVYASAFPGGIIPVVGMEGLKAKVTFTIEITTNPEKPIRKYVSAVIADLTEAQKNMSYVPKGAILNL
jgi:hypothetical protein